MRRKKKNKKLHKIVGVVGEGITESYYIKGLSKENSKRFLFKPELKNGLEFEGILKLGLELIKNDPYDFVVCLIDLDDVNKDSTSKAKYASLKKKVLKNKKIKILESDPCIEFWFLLHFIKFSTRKFQNCSQVVTQLKTHLVNYNKSAKTLKYLIKDLKSKGDINLAIENGDRIEKYLQANQHASSSLSELFKLFPPSSNEFPFDASY